jgi:7,8-dihydroneopterin aldolase/epimerase/oxygenase
MDTILIKELEVWYRVGVPDLERAEPQRLLIDIGIEHPFDAAASGDDLEQTVDYSAVCRQLVSFGEGRSWRLLETLSVEIAETLIRNYRIRAVTLEIRKFILPETRYVGVRIRREAAAGSGEAR